MRQEPDDLGILFEHDLCPGLPVRIARGNMESLFILKRSRQEGQKPVLRFLFRQLESDPGLVRRRSAVRNVMHLDHKIGTSRNQLRASMETKIRGRRAR